MFSNIPKVTRTILIINVIVFLIEFIQSPSNPQQSWLADYGSLHFFLASDFYLFQFITYQFLHGGFTHLFFNMFALWMFGCVIENVWGPKKFIFYYILCGVGAGICQELVQYVQYVSDGQLQALGLDGALRVNTGTDVITMTVQQYLNSWGTIGASGAVYAILLAFGMTFPNEHIFIFPLPVPIKAKWFVCIYAAIELFSAVSSSGDGVAHMAHLGGMLFGFLLIIYWRKHPDINFDLGGSRQFFERWGSKRSGGSRTTSYSGGSNFSGNSSFSREPGYGSTREDDMEYNARKKARQEEVDIILDKIRKSGYDSLTKAEKQRLFEASREG